MTIITLEAIEARQAEVGAMIEQYRAQSTARTIDIEADTITLQPGEHYAGAVLDEHGQFTHHLILLPARPSRKVTWTAAMDWAEDVGGALPTRQEQTLLFAHCKQHIEPAWHWSCEEYEDVSSAWLCDFFDGLQTNYRKSFEGCAVAVRRA